MMRIISRVLPGRIRRSLAGLASLCRECRSRIQLGRLRSQVWHLDQPVLLHCGPHRVRITDGPNFYMQYKDVFVRRIYHFEANRPDPLIIDAGSNVGLSILYFKHVFPRARIIGFEPDPGIFEILRENVRLNGLDDVTLINAGLADYTGCATFRSDGSAGGKLSEGSTSSTVRVDSLSRYLNRPVDFLKLNIEGYELPVLCEAAASDKLRSVRELVVEYHGFPQQQQRLGKLLNLLDEQGYHYLIHDFDAETCRATKPPFQYREQESWFCLVYARRA